MLRKKITLVYLFSLSTLGFSQEIDYLKVKKTGKILCNCFTSSVGLETSSRISSCGQILSKGLSVIKSDSLRHGYFKKVDTYLQKNCREYILIQKSEGKNSDIELVTLDKYNNLKKTEIKLNYSTFKNKTFYYRDFIGDSILIRVEKGNWIEKSKLYNTTTTFLIEQNEKSAKLIFKGSEEEFFNDFYQKDEVIDLVLTKDGDNFYKLLLKFSNGIVLRKRLWVLKNN